MKYATPGSRCGTRGERGWRGEKGVGETWRTSICGLGTRCDVLCLCDGPVLPLFSKWLSPYNVAALFDRFIGAAAFAGELSFFFVVTLAIIKPRDEAALRTLPDNYEERFKKSRVLHSAYTDNRAYYALALLCISLSLILFTTRNLITDFKRLNSLSRSISVYLSFLTLHIALFEIYVYLLSYLCVFKFTPH